MERKHLKKHLIKASRFKPSLGRSCSLLFVAACLSSAPRKSLSPCVNATVRTVFSLKSESYYLHLIPSPVFNPESFLTDLFYGKPPQ